MSLLWLDLETCGLRPTKDALLEVAAIVTTDDLTEVARFERVIYYEKAADIATMFKGMEPDDAFLKTYGAEIGIDPFVLEMHNTNNLWSASAEGMALDTVDRQLAAFVQEHAVKTTWLEFGPTGTGKSVLDKPQLAGSTISFDRGFIEHHLPRSEKMLHHRNCDVSTFNEAARRFWPDVYASRPGTSKNASHRGMDDIQASIEVFKHYLARLTPTLVQTEFNPNTQTAVGL